MSADDGIYIGSFFHNGKKFYSVAWAQAIENLDYCRSLGEERLREYVQKIWGREGVFFANPDKALEYAVKMERDYSTEYGVTDVGDLGISIF